MSVCGTYISAHPITIEYLVGVNTMMQWEGSEYLRVDTMVQRVGNEHQKDGYRSNKDIREMVKVSILWYGDQISCHKSFGKLNCKLCMKERVLILDEMRKSKKSGKSSLSNTT